MEGLFLAIGHRIPEDNTGELSKNRKEAFVVLCEDTIKFIDRLHDPWS